MVSALHEGTLHLLSVDLPADHYNERDKLRSAVNPGPLMQEEHGGDHGHDKEHHPPKVKNIQVRLL